MYHIPGYIKAILAIGLPVMISLFLDGCKKNVAAPANVSVYVTGWDSGNMVYWKNGIKNVLAPLTSSAPSNVTGIAVANDSVYAIGYRGDTALFWHNGMEQYLAIPDSAISWATSITVSGSDIYIGGYETVYGAGRLIYWKNGVKTVVSWTSGLVNSASIALSGNDVYMATSVAYGTAAYWVNGTPQLLGSGNSLAFGITLSGNDAYVAGVDNSVPVYWKNGTETVLPEVSFATAYGIAFSGSDLYISGVDSGRAVYWKNGKENFLDSTNGATVLPALAVSGSDVYVTETEYASSTTQAVYWKNGKRVILGGSNAGANAIAVVSN